MVDIPCVPDHLPGGSISSTTNCRTRRRIVDHLLGSLGPHVPIDDRCTSSVAWDCVFDAQPTPCRRVSQPDNLGRGRSPPEWPTSRPRARASLRHPDSVPFRHDEHRSRRVPPAADHATRPPVGWRWIVRCPRMTTLWTQPTQIPFRELRPDRSVARDSMWRNGVGPRMARVRGDRKRAEPIRCRVLPRGPSRRYRRSAGTSDPGSCPSTRPGCR